MWTKPRTMITSGDSRADRFLGSYKRSEVRSNSRSSLVESLSVTTMKAKADGLSAELRKRNATTADVFSVGELIYDLVDRLIKDFRNSRGRL